MTVNSTKHFLALNDNLFSIFDILENDKNDHLILIIPTDSEIFEGQINFSIIKSLCLDFLKVVIFVTEDEKGLKLIQRSGLVGVKKISQVTIDLWQVAEKRVYSSSKNQIQEVETKNSDNDVRNTSALNHDESIIANKEHALPNFDNYEVSAVETNETIFYLGKDVKKIKQSTYSAPSSTIIKNLNSAGKDFGRMLSGKQSTFNKKSSLLKESFFSNFTNLSFQNIFRKKTIRKIILGLLIIIIFLFLVIYIVLNFLIAEVSINLKKRDFIDEYTIIANKDFPDEIESTTDGIRIRIEGELLENISLSKTYNVSKKTQEGNKSIGLITLYNLTEQSLAIPKGTQIKSSVLGKKYIILKDVIIPKVTDNEFGEKLPQSIEDVPIESIDFGESYNLALSEGDDNFIILLPGFEDMTKASGRIFRDIKGGTSTEVNRVLQEDVDMALDQIKEELKTIIRDRAVALITSSEIGLFENIEFETVAQNISPGVGEVSDDGTFTLSLSMNGFIPKISKLILDSASRMYLNTANNENNKISGDLKPKLKSVVYQNGLYIINIGLEGSLGVNILEEDLVNRVKGKFYTNAKEELENTEGIESVKIIFKPGFIPDFLYYIPNDSSRIQVRFF
jgi:hypothetical protein